MSVRCLVLRLIVLLVPAIFNCYLRVAFDFYVSARCLVLCLMFTIKRASSCVVFGCYVSAGCLEFDCNISACRLVFGLIVLFDCYVSALCLMLCLIGCLSALSCIV